MATCSAPPQRTIHVMARNISSPSPTGEATLSPGSQRWLKAPHHFLLACGILLIASGIFHGIVILATGGSFDGPLSWRKPMLFGLSFGITAATIALICPALRLSKTVSWVLLGSLGLASVAETALITMQTWRGVPSHFNFTTTFDAMVFQAMGIIVAIVATALLILTVLSFTNMRPGPSSIILAIRVGMLLLLAGQVLGALIIAHGVQPAVVGNDGAVFGPHGVVFGDTGILKYPHGIAMHAIQVLPVIGLLGLFTQWSPTRRYATVSAASLGYVLIVLVSTLQAYSGRGGLSLSWFEVGLLVLGVLLLIGSGLLSLVATDWRRLLTGQPMLQQR